ncbi:MAG: hypothetical protein LH614_13580 [Pyrinomonadaceae bacterium]|nr:hypothetical protein [Pyrinomonadaceae bacterium]
MENKGIINPQDIQIQGVLDRYLRSRISDNNLALQERHLDEDSLAAFAEGNLSERELKPVVSHLVECSFCRQVTTELVRLDLAFAEEEVKAVVAEKRPSKISEVLESLLSRIFGTNDGAVFAHEEKKEEPENTENLEDLKK